MPSPYLSFVLHTYSLARSDSNWVEAQNAFGLGDLLYTFDSLSLSLKPRTQMSHPSILIAISLFLYLLFFPCKIHSLQGNWCIDSTFTYCHKMFKCFNRKFDISKQAPQLDVKEAFFNITIGSRSISA